MNIGEYMRLGNVLHGAYTAQQQNIVNQQNQQRINDAIATDALNRRIANQKYQDYLTGQQGAGAYWRELGQQPIAPPIGSSPQAPAPAPGQNSAQQPAPQGSAVPSPVPIPGATLTQTPLPPAAQSQPLQQFMPAPPGQQNPYQIPPATQQIRDRGAVSIMQRELQSQQAALQQATTPQQQASIQGNIAALQREIVRMSASAGPALGASAQQVPMQAAPQQAPSATPGAPQGGLDNSLSGMQGTYGRVLALAQNNQVINLAGKAAAELIKAHPDWTDRQLSLAMDNIYPALSEQSKNMLQLAGLSNTEMFKTVSALLRQQELGARYPGMGGQTPYSPQAVDAAAQAWKNGVKPPVAMIPWVLQAHPELGGQVAQGQVNLTGQKAAAGASATAPIKVQQAADTAVATAVPRATGSALTQVQKNLSAIEPAYQAMDANFEGLIQAAQKYGLGPATPVNSLLNRMRKMGDPSYTTYEVFLKGVQKEFGKVLQGSTGARGISVSAMKDAEGTLSPNMTLGQLEAAATALKTEGGNVLQSLRDQKQHLTQQLGGNTNSSPGQPPEVISQAQYDALPKGAQYMHDGKVYTKGGA